MKLTKKDILKLTTFYENLSKYLANWTTPNFFWYDSKYEKDLCQEIAIDCDSIEEANRHYNELDQEDKDRIKNMLKAKELSFKANPTAPHYYVKFNYIKKC